MNKEEIIKLAQEAGLIRAGENYTEPARWGISEITDFYNRVAAAEREACAAICDRFQARDVGMQPAECAGAIRARGNT
tara:strand:- start:19 stop:252 length:234 start_codon:yes stop_codon:yes gene_type:complete